MLTLYIADVERDAGMKKLSREEAAKVLEGMKVKTEIPKAAVTQWERNAALDMAIEVLNCSEIPNKSDTISRQAAVDAIMGQPPEPHYPSWYAAQIKKLPAVQPDHNADVSKKVDMMHEYEYIYKIVKDCDGVNCYIKQGKIIRCKDCKHKHVENMVWTCPFGLPGGENFFCGYGTEPYKGK